MDAPAPVSSPQSVAGRNSRDLTQGTIGRTLFAFALPVMGGNLLQSLNGSVNAIWVGRLLGDVALTATGNANQIFFLLLAAGIGLGMAATILIGQAMGRRDLHAAKRVVGTTATFFAALSTAMGLSGYLLTEPVLRLMNTPAAAFGPAVDYLRVIFLALPLLYLNIFAGMALRGAGDSRTPFRFMIVGVVLDIVLNPLLITGWGPFPRMGIMGSAMSTLIGQAGALGGLVLYLIARKSPLILRGPDLALFRPDRALIRTIVVKGVPMGLQMLVVSISGIAMIGVANGYGVSTVAGYNIAIQLWAYVQMPAMAIGAAASSMAAQNIGAKRWDRVGQVAWKGVILATGVTAIGIAAVWTFEHSLVQLFLPGDPAALAVAERVNLWGLWGWLFFGGMMVLSAVVRSAGAVWAPLVIVAVSLVGLRIPFVLYAQRWLGADAIWMSSTVSLAIAFLMTWGYYRFGNWRSARMEPARATEAAPAEAPVSGPAQAQTVPAQ